MLLEQDPHHPKRGRDRLLKNAMSWAMGARQHPLPSPPALLQHQRHRVVPGGALLEGPLHRARAAPLPDCLGTLLSSFRRFNFQRLRQTRRDQQRHDLTRRLPAKGPAPSTSGSPASRSTKKRQGGGREQSPAPTSPTQTSAKAFPGEGGLHGQHPCMQPPSPPPPSPLPPPKLALGPRLPEQSRRGLLL